MADAEINVEEYLPNVRAYMDEMKKLLGDLLDYFEISIDYIIYESPSGQIQSEHYSLEMTVRHILSVGEVFPYIQEHGSDALGHSYTIDSFWNGEHGNSFCMAQTAGRKLYYILRKEYPIVRHLRWKS